MERPCGSTLSSKLPLTFRASTAEFGGMPNGRNYIIDVSQFGTAVNGHALVPNKETELPPKATINLANVITLEWEKS